jgi:hypothetical protein
LGEQHAEMVRHPTIFEINTWVWLSGLSRKFGVSPTLACVPAREWDAIADFGFDAVWLMGVWERSPAGIAIANRNPGLLEDFRRALPDFRLPDNVGSPYCVRRYTVDPHLGGPVGLETARKELAKRSMRLLLDFVPNHVAPDHPWVTEHPEYFIRGTADDARNDPSSFLAGRGAVFACGRDPNFPAWPDVLQLNPYHPGLRQAVRDTVSDIARRCDGIRCDMAMLLLNAIVDRTWGSRAGQQPATEYWADLIPAIKSAHPEFLFVAEAYWDLEWELQQLGFDYCYDKRLYDRLRHSDAGAIRSHLGAGLDYQDRLARFLENHDEPRAAAVFAWPRHQAAAIVTALVPGLRFFHQGQFEGARVCVPTHLRRGPVEPRNADIAAFYDRLVSVLKSDGFRDGAWSLIPPQPAWDGNPTGQDFVSFAWQTRDGGGYVVVVNYSDHQGQCHLRLPFAGLADRKIRLVDMMGSEVYDRDGAGLVEPGLFIDLRAWRYNVFRLESVEQGI